MPSLVDSESSYGVDAGSFFMSVVSRTLSVECFPLAAGVNSSLFQLS